MRFISNDDDDDRRNPFKTGGDDGGPKRVSLFTDMASYPIPSIELILTHTQTGQSRY